MKRTSHSFNGQDGVSLIETLVVIGIIAIVAGLALMQSGSANAVFKRQNASRQLKVAFERARFDSVKRRTTVIANPASVTVTSSSFTLRTYSSDVNGNSVSSDQVTSLPTGVLIARYDGGSLPMTISFNMRGETPAFPAPQFYVCNVTCSSPSKATADIVLVTPTGTVNLLAGDATLPTFGVPTITSVSNSAGINPDAVLP